MSPLQLRYIASSRASSCTTWRRVGNAPSSETRHTVQVDRYGLLANADSRRVSRRHLLRTLDAPAADGGRRRPSGPAKPIRSNILTRATIAIDSFRPSDKSRANLLKGRKNGEMRFAGLSFGGAVICRNAGVSALDWEPSTALLRL